MRDYSEKRDFHRMQVDTRIDLTDTAGNTYQGVCRDLSGTGMQIILDRALDEGTQLHTVLPSSSDQFPPFETVVTVIRCVPEGDRYRLGTAITEVKR
ncbi:pilus assembly protein PilZ [Tamilnaduibacter salinus]|nr:pilus assembly protein PilZ [Tamilnaduibacter salinus]